MNYMLQLPWFQAHANIENPNGEEAAWSGRKFLEKEWEEKQDWEGR